ncbi:hypothetical protein pb186bvf_007201 [Paramecium bursaria]
MQNLQMDLKTSIQIRICVLKHIRILLDLLPRTNMKAGKQKAFLELL